MPFEGCHGRRPRLDLHIDLIRCLFEVLQERRAQPPIQAKLRRVVPVAVGVSAAPFEPKPVTWERAAREQQSESARGVRDVCHRPVDQSIRPTDEGFLEEPHARIVKDPGAEVFVWRDKINGIHDAGL